MARPMQILAIGGGGSRGGPAYRGIEDYLLSLASKERPAICFLPTASGDDDRYVNTFYSSFASGRAAASHLRLHGVPREDLRDFLLSQDVIYVGGGNTANMLAVWRVHGIDQILGEAYVRGTVLAGWSAGMICWFEAGVTDSFGPLRDLNDGLQFLSGSACPHYDGEPRRRPTYQRLVSQGFPAGYAADDYAALHFVDGQLARCVASQPLARCYRVELRGDQVHEEPLPTEYLGAAMRQAPSPGQWSDPSSGGMVV